MLKLSGAKLDIHVTLVIQVLTLAWRFIVVEVSADLAMRRTVVQQFAKGKFDVRSENIAIQWAVIPADRDTTGSVFLDVLASGPEIVCLDASFGVERSYGALSVCKLRASVGSLAIVVVAFLDRHCRACIRDTREAK